MAVEPKRGSVRLPESQDFVDTSLWTPPLPRVEVLLLNTIR